MRSYRHPFFINPLTYPDDEAWLINRFLYIYKLEIENPMLDWRRQTIIERMWIKKNKPDIHAKAFLLLFDQMSLVSEREERMPYMEVCSE